MTIQLFEKIENFEREELNKLKHHPRERDLLAPRIHEFSKSLFRMVALLQQNRTSLPQITRIINQNIAAERTKLKESYELYRSEVQESRNSSSVLTQLLTEPRPQREPIKAPERTPLITSFEAHLNERIAHSMAAARVMSTVSETVGTAVGKTLSLVPFAEKIEEGVVYTLQAAKEAGRQILSPEARQFLSRFMNEQNRPLVDELSRRGFSEGDALQYAKDSKVVALATVSSPPIFKCVKVGRKNLSRILSNSLTPITETSFANFSEYSAVFENIQAMSHHSPSLSKRFVRDVTQVTEKDIGIVPQAFDRVKDCRLVEITMEMQHKVLVFKVGYLEVPNNAFSLPRAINNAKQIARTNQATAVELRATLINKKLKDILYKRYSEYLVHDPLNPYTSVFRIPLKP